MKKTILLLILSAMLLMCITACSGSKDPEPTPGGDQTIYEKLDGFADLNYQQINLTVATFTGDLQLSASYMLTQNDVSYSVEQFNMLPSNGDLTEIFSKYKTTYTGKAKIIDGRVTELDGEAVTLPSYDELKGDFSFAKDNFENVTMQENLFSADVVSPSAFYGSFVNVQNMKLAVEYTETSLSKIVITYQTVNSKVTTIYEFTI